MYIKLIHLISIVLVLVLTGNTSADTIEWDGGGDPNLWNIAENWDPNIVPGPDDTVRIDISDANCLIDSSVDAECLTLFVSRNNVPCYLNMTGGTLTTQGHIRIAEPSDSNASVRHKKTHCFQRAIKNRPPH